ncbi:hypothetical protein [Granulicella sp. dw_53]|uniref:hypothetical protein n=1 Tax=Granulicella sp. dw_53 TaxID=2719792 RepID=UPI001BD65AE8|nr:hypothetical protein [Granulicella sp. dw_53]
MAWAAMAFPPESADTTADEYVYGVLDDTSARHLFYRTQADPAYGGRTTDGSGLLMAMEANTVHFVDKSGIRHSGAFDQIIPGADDAWTDPDGNGVTPYMNGSQIEYWIDSIGRRVPAPAEIGLAGAPGCYTTQFPAVNVGTAPYTFCYQKVFVTSANIGTPPTSSEYEYSNNLTLLSSLILPDNTAYTFAYNNSGDLTRITLPQGGSISYTWITAQTDRNNTSSFQRAVLTRTLNTGNGAPDQIWRYTYQIAYGYAISLATVTDPLNNDTSYSNTAPFSSLQGSNTEIHYQGAASAGNILYRSDECLQWNGGIVYAFAYPYVQPSVLSCGTKTTLGDGSTSQTSIAYDPAQTVTDPLNQWDTEAEAMSLGLPVAITQTDYGAGEPGAVLKTTTTKYEWQVNSNYLAANLMGIPYSTTVTDGDGAQLSQITFGYDENNGSPQGTFGHQTSVNSWLNTTGSSIETSRIYNSQGMLVVSRDPNQNQMAITSYQCSGLFPQTLVSAYQSAMTMAETTSYGYDCNTGKLVSVTDSNGNLKQYFYADPLGRLTQSKEFVGTPSESWTVYTYPNATQINVNQDKTIKGDGIFQHSYIYNGLGQVIQAISPDTSIIDTTYDLVGKIATISNPHFPGVGSNGFTSYIYDALGRVKTQIQPDNNTQQWLYSGAVTTFTDESEHAWRRTLDTLGRLTKVIEPNGAATTYSYDALDDLRCADQWDVGQVGLPCSSSRYRQFVYDSLSRLTSAHNPETGTIVNGYDGNGNLSVKTDARGITQLYRYDALNRLLSKTYRNDPFGTASSCYQYDSAPGGIGLLGAEWTQAGDCPVAVPTAGAKTKRTILAYSPVGRVTSEQQCVLSSCAASHTVSYGYDLAGNLTSSTNGTGLLVFTNQYDGASRPQSITVTSPWTDITHPATLFSNPVYGPAGLSSAVLGATMTINRTYDNRQRVLSETVSRP